MLHRRQTRRSSDPGDVLRFLADKRPGSPASPTGLPASSAAGDVPDRSSFSFPPAGRRRSHGPVEWFHESPAESGRALPYSPAMSALLERNFTDGNHRLVFRVKGGLGQPQDVEYSVDLDAMTIRGPDGSAALLRHPPGGGAAAQPDCKASGHSSIHSALKKQTNKLKSLTRKVDLGEAGRTHKSVKVFDVPDNDFDW
eukprot:EG_transcript_29852